VLVCLGAWLVWFHVDATPVPGHQRPPARYPPSVVEAAAAWGISLELSDLVMRSARRYRLAPAGAYALVHVESRFQPGATSPTGAIGLAQVLHSTARDLDPGITRRELYDPAVNLDLGFRYLRRMCNRYRQRGARALLAYNQGMAVADTHSTPEHDGYVRAVGTPGVCGPHSE
jgi:soluble lytic murein transglycosylase-like protein